MARSCHRTRDVSHDGEKFFRDVKKHHNGPEHCFPASQRRGFPLQRPLAERDISRPSLRLTISPIEENGCCGRIGMGRKENGIPSAKMLPLFTTPVLRKNVWRKRNRREKIVEKIFAAI